MDPVLANLILRLAALATFAAVTLAGDATDPSTIAGAIGGLLAGVTVAGPGQGNLDQGNG